MTTRPVVLFEAQFSSKLKIYLFAYGALSLCATVVGIVLLPLWAVAGSWWARRHHASLRCRLTERSLVVGKGILFRREVTIPLDKIQDISLREGPLLQSLGLLRLRVETAGHSGSATGKSEADLVGLIDARQVRDRILEQRDRVASSDIPSIEQEMPRHLLVEIRDSLLRIEAGIQSGARSEGAGDRRAPVASAGARDIAHRATRG